MKKAIALILSFVYLATSMGATVNLHYCMDKLVEQQLLMHRDKDESCSNCGMEKAKQNNGCCKHEQKQVKVDQPSQVPDLAVKVFHPHPAILPGSFLDIPAIAITSVTEDYPVSNAPPRSNKTSIYLRNRVFLI